jgi:LysR family cys regulon transcriptional activator
MTLQQLRYLCGVVAADLSVSRAARALHTSQPGISKQIQMLERELGVDLLIRQGNRISGLTEAGADVLEVARRMLLDAEHLKRIGEELTHRQEGRLVVATTHIQARYLLRDVIRRFTVRYPEVRLTLRQGSPAQIAQWVVAGEADIGVAGRPPEADSPPELAFLPGESFDRSVIALRNHPILRSRKKLTLAAVAAYPIITLDASFAGGAAVRDAFRAAGIAPNIVLSAIDVDIIKTYAELGLGIAIVPSVAYEPARDKKLAMRSAAHLFAPTVTQVELRRGNYLRSYMIDFIGMLQPRWDRAAIEKALRAGPPER